MGTPCTPPAGNILQPRRSAYCLFKMFFKIAATASVAICRLPFTPIVPSTEPMPPSPMSANWSSSCSLPVCCRRAPIKPSLRHGLSPISDLQKIGRQSSKARCKPRSHPMSRRRLTDAGLSLKYVLREGSLQDKSGPSIATEFGTLLPGIGADAGVGGTWATIISERWDWGTIHLNLQPSLTRDHRAELFVSTILEGPSKWKVRPVAEVFFDEKFDQETEVSGLVGLIWQARESVAVDFAVRAASVNGRPSRKSGQASHSEFPFGALNSVCRG